MLHSPSPSETVLNALRAAADPTRLRLLGLLARGELTVSEITQILGQSQPRVSRHLKLMGEAGLLERFREGSWVFYRLAEAGAPAAHLAGAVIDALGADDPVLARDRERLAGVRAQRAAEAEAYFRAHAASWDEVRALHIADREVEAAMRAAVGEAPVGLHVDLGTGTGRTLLLFADLAARGIGIDTSHDMLTLARAAIARSGAAHLMVRHGDLFAPPLEAHGADLVTMHLVLHYLDDPGTALGEAARLLAPGGRLLVVDFAPHELEFLREAHAHRRLGFPVREVAGLGEAAGLELLASRELPPGEAESARLTVTLWLFGARGGEGGR